MKNGKSEFKQILETTFDIPFHIENGITNGDPWYKIRPTGYTNELFEIRLVFLNRLRLNMEFLPDNYGISLINDMANSSPEQRATFLKHAKILEERKAKLDFSINNIAVSVVDYSDWPQQWNSIKLKVTKSPVVKEDELFSPEKIATDWGCIFIGMILSLLDVVPINEETEGDLYRVVTNRYERSPVNRNLCLTAKGYTCRVCGMDFKSKYGELGTGYIHVHHTILVSEIGPKYIIDPIKDLEPVCPNCHAMLHRKYPPLGIEELKKKLT